MSVSHSEPIAIVGMGCRFPGKVETSAGLWDLAAAGRQEMGPVPADRWDAERLMAFQNPDEAARYGRGCFLEGDVWAGDPEALNVAPAEQRWVDPQFRVLMEVAWEAVEHAGIPVDRLRGSRTGVYVGAYTPDNLFREARPVEAALLTSQRGESFAFDARADGYVRGEGAAMLLLKRLSDARRDGDRVLAVIRGGAVNNDGQATRLTAPSTEMQQVLFRAAVERARIDPGQVGLVEAHGPGTPVGDPVEYNSINAVFGRGSGRCALGSIKTNIGHSEPVSGLAGTIKAIECMRRGLIAPNANFRTWNPAIVVDEDSRLFIPTEVTPWPVDGGPRLAAVCSYGVTGTNAHIILESAPVTSRRPGPRATVATDARPRLFTLSGVSAESVTLAAGRLAEWVEGEGAGTDLDEVARTLAVHRSHAAHRAAIVARDRRELVARAEAFAAGATADRCSSSPARARSGPECARGFWSRSRTSPPPSTRSNS